LTVVVGAEDVERQLKEAYKKIGSKAHIKGFRPGKIPRSVLEQYYRSDAESQAIRDLVQESYPKAVHESGLNPIAPPQIKITTFGPSQDLTYEAMIEIPPQFE